ICAFQSIRMPSRISLRVSLVTLSRCTFMLASSGFAVIADCKAERAHDPPLSLEVPGEETRARLEHSERSVHALAVVPEQSAPRDERKSCAERDAQHREQDQHGEHLRGIELEVRLQDQVAEP